MTTRVDALREGLRTAVQLRPGPPCAHSTRVVCLPSKQAIGVQLSVGAPNLYIVLMKTIERNEAIRLRSSEGLSIREIARVLRVSPTSVSAWVSGITVSPEHTRRLSENMKERGRVGRENASLIAKARRMVWQEEGRKAARGNDSFHASGCMLYWGEGGKGRNQIALANSDPELLCFFVRFLRKYFSVDSASLRLRINCFTDIRSIEEITKWWGTRLGVPVTCFCKPTICMPSKSSKGTRSGKLEYGTCTVVVNQTKIVQHIYGALQEYAGFQRQEWGQ